MMYTNSLNVGTKVSVAFGRISYSNKHLKKSFKFLKICIYHHIFFHIKIALNTHNSLYINY